MDHIGSLDLGFKDDYLPNSHKVLSQDWDSQPFSDWNFDRTKLPILHVPKDFHGGTVTSEFRPYVPEYLVQNMLEDKTQ